MVLLELLEVALDLCSFLLELLLSLFHGIELSPELYHLDVVCKMFVSHGAKGASLFTLGEVGDAGRLKTLDFFP